jgi:hypothetical protein
VEILEVGLGDFAEGEVGCFHFWKDRMRIVGAKLRNSLFKVSYGCEIQAVWYISGGLGREEEGRSTRNRRDCNLSIKSRLNFTADTGS